MNSQIIETASAPSGDKGALDGEYSIKQSDNQVVSQTSFSLATDTQQSTTRFDSAGNSAQTMISIPRNHNLIPNQYDDIRAFLMKPALVQYGTWTTAQTTASAVISLTSIAGHLGSVTQWAKKIEGFTLIRGTANFRLVLNANPMQQGRLKLVWWPLWSTDPGSSRVKNLATISMLPGVEICANDTEGVLSIPYIAPSDYCSVKFLGYDWGAYGLYVFVPLATGTNGETSVSYSLYLSWSDIELTAPAVPQSGRAFSPPKPSKLKGERSASTMDRIFESAGRLVSGGLKGIVAPFTSSAPWIVPLVDGVAQMFGFDKPPTNQTPMLVSQLKAPFMATSSGVSTAVQLGLRHDNMVDIPDLGVNGVDEMSFAYLKQVPAVVEYFDLQTSDVVGNSIYSANISPFYLNGTGTYSVSNGGHTATMGVYCPAGYLARYFRFWRGSLRVTLKFTKTKFHTGRYQITWTPTNDSAVTSPTITTGVLAIREIVDLSGADEITLDLPYMLSTPWIDATKNNLYSGRLDVVCLNPLRAPEVCSSAVRVLMYLSGGCDFELAGFNLVNKNGGVLNKPQPAMYAQSGAFNETDQHLIQDSKIGEIGSCSTQDHLPQRMCMGEVFTHLRQLLGKYANITFNTEAYAQTTLKTDTSGQAFINPFLSATSLPQFTAASGFVYPSGVTLQSEILNGFAYYRGSLNLVIAVDPASADTTPYHNVIGTTLSSIDNASIGFNGSSNSTQTDWGGTLLTKSNGAISMASLPSIVNESTQIHNGNIGIAEVRVPYYQKFRLTPTLCANTTAFGPFVGVDIRVFGTSTISTLKAGISTGEDFLATLFIGFPAVLIAYA